MRLQTSRHNSITLSVVFVLAFSPSGFLPAQKVFPAGIAENTPQETRVRGSSIELPIFLYHHIRPITADMSALAQGLSVTPASFEKQLQYFQQNGYRSVPITTLITVLHDGGTLGPKSIALTFDDGYEDLHTYAWPLLKKYGFHATAFVIINRIDTEDYASWDQIKEMEASGIIDIQSHTLNHPLLTKLSPNQALREIRQSKLILEEKLHKKISVFCYPYGDYNQSIAQAVQEAGYSAALSTKGGTRHTKDGIFELKRARLSTHDVGLVLAKKMQYFFRQKAS